MENIGASVSAVLTNEKKEEYKKMKNKVIFFLGWDKEFYLYAASDWCENAQGKVVGGVDTYFYRLVDGRRCESVRDALKGWGPIDTETHNQWETLCRGIEKLPDLSKTICTRKKVLIW